VTRIALSNLPHTWLIDLDGTIVKHNGYKNGDDELLPGIREFWEKIPPADYIVVLSARDKGQKDEALRFFRRHGLRVDEILFGLPTGERVILNDCKPGGLLTAVAVNVGRDCGLAEVTVDIDILR